MIHVKRGTSCFDIGRQDIYLLEKGDMLTCDHRLELPFCREESGAYIVEADTVFIVDNEDEGVFD